MTDRENLAAEHALRLLSGEDLLQARGLQATDGTFAAEVAWWEERFAPLTSEIAPVEPRPDLWERIASALPGEGEDKIVLMRRKLRQWQAATGLAAAAAVAMALVAVPRLVQAPVPPAPTWQTAPPPQPQGPPPAQQTPPQQQTVPPPVEQPEPSPVLIAAVASEQEPGSVAVTFVAERSELLVSAAGFEPAAGRDRQLWIIPAGGSPISLGLVEQGPASERRLPQRLAGRFRAGATIAVSVEPPGGSRTGQPTGPVVATGQLSAF